MIQKSIKIVLIGMGSVGKTALTLQFMYDEFTEDYEPTKSDIYKKDLSDPKYCIDILDTAGQETAGNIHSSLVKQGHGYMLVCSVDNKESVESLGHYRDEVYRLNPSNEKTPILLVGNKIDLGKPNHEELLMEKANLWNVPYILTSAKTCTKVTEAFMQLYEMTKALIESADCAATTKAAKKSRKCCFY